MQDLPSVCVHWFRNDLRLKDNPALLNISHCEALLPIYIVEPLEEKTAVDSCQRWWIRTNLEALNETLDGCLNVYHGTAISVFETLLKRYNIAVVSWNRLYDPASIARDRQLKVILERENKLSVRTVNGSLLWEPWEVLKEDKQPYKVFTPFWKQANKRPVRLPSLDVPKIRYVRDPAARKSALRELFPPRHWHTKLDSLWEGGECAAQRRLSHFIQFRLQGYGHGRDYPAQQKTSALSPYLRLGILSPQQIWYAVVQNVMEQNAESFLRELGWREFSYHLLYHFSNLDKECLNPSYRQMPWNGDSEFVELWKRGRTGFPLVDAGMRELWNTGSMHNRVRMIVASFLTKNLFVDWRIGAQWFMETLLDADLASNSASWQWVAGCGTDSVPYYRIFNPTLQAKQFDPDGTYIKRYVPELAQLPVPNVFSPSEAPQELLQRCGIDLGNSYPHPIISLKTSRQYALAMYATHARL